MPETAGVTKRRVLIETRVIVEPGWVPWDVRHDEEKRHKWLKEWAAELMAFFRDHRHQDVNSVHVDPVHQIQCSGCHAEWEEMFDEETGKTCCASCGEPMETIT